MKTLSIDVASHEGHIACIDSDAIKAVRIVGRVNDAELVPLSQEVLREAGWNVNDIERIACNVGPGGFTSVRNGVTFANAMADQLDSSVAGYHGSELMILRAAANVRAWHAMPVQHHGAENFWIHSTRSDQAFIRGGPWKEPTLVSLTDAIAAVSPGATVVGDLTDAHRAALAAKGVSWPPMSSLETVLPAFLDSLSYAKKGLVPWYGRGI